MKEALNLLQNTTCTPEIIISGLLSRHDNNINFADEADGLTLLHWSIKMQRYDVFSALIAREDINLNAVDKNKETILHLLAVHLPVSKRIIKKLSLLTPFAPNISNTDNKTPLQLAMQQERMNIEFIKLLLKLGADYTNEMVNSIVTTNEARLTLAFAERAAALCDEPALEKFCAVMTPGAKCSLLIKAAKAGKAETIIWLLNNNHITTEQIDGTALIAALQADHIELAQWLIRNKSVREDYYACYTALLLAKWAGHTEFVQWR